MINTIRVGDAVRARLLAVAGRAQARVLLSIHVGPKDRVGYEGGEYPVDGMFHCKIAVRGSDFG